MGRINRKKLEIEDDVYNIIVDQVYELNTGARSLQTIMNNIRTRFIKKVLRGTDSIIYLNCEDVIDKSTIRKGRN
ncbi:MAG: hypothetical protein GX247_05090 [Mollicutes bacterium]|nr:hypothetical protein [Mollicutes bacterium]